LEIVRLLDNPDADEEPIDDPDRGEITIDRDIPEAEAVPVAVPLWVVNTIDTNDPLADAVKNPP
jgi:hypothetical protein